MEPFKNLFNEKSVNHIASSIKKAYQPFPSSAFVKKVLPQIKDEELKGRVRVISKILHDFLPEFPEAAKILAATIQSKRNPNGLSGFSAWPLTQYVEDFGLSHWKESMAALKSITTVMSAEFAIRPFLIQQKDETLDLLMQWASDPNVHVRRLCSEGSRPLLPWGQRLKEVQKKPELTIPILRKLKCDPELYVRKSVANHLNDIAKDHPKIVIKELQAWLKQDPQNKNIQWIVKHASRSLIKNGNKDALSLLGVKPASAEKIKLEITPSEVKMGGHIEIMFSAVAKREEKWLVDYIVHHQKSNGSLSPKVFKWTIKNVEKGQISLIKKHGFKKITTRKYYPGEHHIEIQLNGSPVIKKKFHLKKSV